jgi:hypothetical protein
MEFEFHDERGLFDTHTVPDGISNNDTGRDAHANLYASAYVDADSFSDPNRNTHSRTQRNTWHHTDAHSGADSYSGCHALSYSDARSASCEPLDADAGSDRR